MNQKPLFLAVALTALLVIGGAFWMMQKRQVAVNQPVVTDPAIEVPVQVEPENPVDTSEWKTYRNDEYGFEFKLPLSWSIERTTTPASFYLKSDTFTPVLLGYTAKHESDYSTGEILVWVSANNNDLSIKDRYLQYDDSSRLYFAVNEIPRREIRINDNEAVVFESYVENDPNSGNTKYHKVCILKIKNKILHFDYISQGKPDPRIEQILESVVRSVSDV